MRAIKDNCKELIRSQLRASGFEIVRRPASNGASMPLLRLLIERVISSRGEGAILQIGANDGVFDDPVHEIIVSLNLPAILVEPLPDLFEQLRRNYEHTPRTHFENVAIGAQPGGANIFRVSPGTPGLPQWLQGVASFDKAVLINQRRRSDVRGVDIERFIETIPVSVITIGQLLERHPDIGPIIALQVDTEGHDFVVVKSALDAGCRPNIICYEHKHLSYNDAVACRELLSTEGYSFCSVGQDTIAYREADAPSETVTMGRGMISASVQNG